MKSIELQNLKRLAARFELDPMEIDSSLSYAENKAHLTALAEAYGKKDCFEEKALAAYEAFKTCPKCHEKGVGLYSKWVLNAVKRRYEPYYYYAHSYKANGKWKIKWCYIGKL